MSEIIEHQSKAVSREKIMLLQEAAMALPDENKVEIDSLTTHYFADGIYLRQLFIPAGVMVVGKIHRTDHLTIICSGTVRVTTDNGVEEITGPAVFRTGIGAKKAAFAITDCVIMNPHPTHETDLKKIEEQFIAPSFEALESDTGTLEHDTEELEKEL